MSMEILTALQWAKKGFIPNEGVKGTEQWTNCYYSAKAVYFKDSEVHEDKDAAKPSCLPKGRSTGMQPRNGRRKEKKCCIPRENENPVAMVTGGKNT